jgi:hypothetical protein
MLIVDQPSAGRRISVMWRVLKTKLLELNLFNSELTLDDDLHRHREIKTTRIYLVLLTLAVIILVIYTWIETETQIVKILNPSQQQFDELRSDPQYSATLDCPCQNIIVPYQAFISIKPHYHQLCSSDFVATNSTWISLLYSPTAGIDYPYDDYRLFGAPQFQLLSSLCTLANETLTEAITQFFTNIITNERVQSSESIGIQAESILSQFRLSTPRTFVRTLDFIRYMAQGNGIVSSIFSNWHFVSLHTRLQYDALWAEPYSYANGSCSCGTNAMCTSEASFNGSIVPGFRVGCYPLEALLQSTLECLYNVSCIDQLKFMYYYSNITFNPLDASLSSSNATVQSLVDGLLVENWESSVVYEQYYSTCAPLSCSYTFDGKINLIYTITTIIGLYGGLTIVFKLISPVLMQIVDYLIMRRRQQFQTAVIEIRVGH